MVHRTKPSNQTPQFAFHTNPNLALLQTSHSTSFSCSVEQHLSLRLAQTAKDSIDSSRQDARTLSYRHIITGLSSFCLQDSFGKCVKAVGTRDIVSWKHGFPHLLIYVSCAFLLFPVLAPQSIGLLQCDAYCILKLHLIKLPRLSSTVTCFVSLLFVVYQVDSNVWKGPRPGIENFQPFWDTILTQSKHESQQKLTTTPFPTRCRA